MLSDKEALADATLLIVDDQTANVLLLRRTLERAGYADLVCATDPREAISLYERHGPDLILLDLHMPHLSGYDLLRQWQERIPEGTYLPILVLTGDITPAAKQQALSLGAKDFLTKPFDLPEVLLRIKNLLETRTLHLRLQNQNQALEDRVRERTRELEEAQHEILERLARASEFRDDLTGQHTHRVGALAALIARELGLPEEEVDLIRRTAPLHDLGKIGISDGILLKPGKLTEEEMDRMKAHTGIGSMILSGSRHPLLQMAEQIALTHHLCWDGSGYPFDWKGEEIPLAGRIVAVADYFDALTHDRPYKKAWTVRDAVAALRRESGRRFDPQVVSALLRALQIEMPGNFPPVSPPAHPPETESSTLYYASVCADRG